jgi:recombination protein RecT
VSATAVIPARESKKDIDALLKSDQFKNAVAKALPKHMTADRFVRVALTAMMRTPKLRECTQESLFKSLLDLSMYGLEPDGRRAHLIPYGNVCTLILDYKGLAELVRRSGDVSYIHADVVCRGDEFDYAYGSGAFLKHKPALEGDRDPKDVFCAYSFVKLKDGSEDFVVLSRGEVEKVRERSRAGKAGPWVTDWSAMAAKTAFRRHSKWLPLSPEVRDAVEADDDAVDIRLADTPDGDPAWLQPGSESAALAVAEEKISALEADAAGKNLPAPYIQDEGKPYTSETLPDACEVKVGTECLFEGDGKLRRLRATEEPGEAAHWVTVEEVGVKAQAAPSQMTPAAAITPATPRAKPTFGRAK